MKINNFRKYLKDGVYSDVVFIFGQEDYLVEKATEALIGEVGKRYAQSYDRDVFDASDADERRVVEICGSMPFMSEKRLVVLKNVEKLYPGRVSKEKVEKSRLGKYLRDPSPSTILIVNSGYDKLKGAGSGKKPASIKFPFPDLLAVSDFVEFPRVYESDFPNWIVKRFADRGKRISDEAAAVLAQSSNPNLRELDSEVEKICLNLEDKDFVEIDDVMRISGSTRAGNVFELQKAVGKRDVATSLAILQRIFNSDPNEKRKILPILIKYFTALFRLIEERGSGNKFQIAGKIGVPPFFVGEYLNSLNVYSPADVEGALIELADADETLKSTRTDEKFVLQNLLISIIERN